MTAIPPPDPTPPKPPRLNGWHFASLVVVLVAGALLVWASFEVFADNTNVDTSLAIIGALLPSVVAIGGAIFGVSAYKTGVTSGATTGEAKAAVADAKRREVVTKALTAIDLALVGVDGLQPTRQGVANTDDGRIREMLIQLRSEIAD